LYKIKVKNTWLLSNAAMMEIPRQVEPDLSQKNANVLEKVKQVTLAIEAHSAQQANTVQSVQEALEDLKVELETMEKLV
jgi:hypothetical protein